MVISQFHLNEGGSERQMLRLSEALLKKDVPVMIVAGAYSKEERETRIGDMVIHRNRIWGIRDGRGNYRLGSYAYMMTLFLFLILHRNKYDVIHAHIAGHNAALSSLAARMLNKGLLVKVANSGRGSDLSRLEKTPFFGKIFLNRIKRADRIVAINPTIKDELLQRGFDPDRIVEIPNGITPVTVGEKMRDEIRAFLKIAPSSRVVVFTGTFSEQKNIRLLLESWEAVVSQVDDALLIMLGDGPEHEYVNRAGLKTKGILAPGRVSNVFEYLAAADIFVLPSRYEGISNSLLEAMCMGLMAVVSDIPGNLRVIAEEGEEPKYTYEEDSVKIYSSGIAVSEGDAKSLARGLIRAIKDIDSSDTMAKNGKRRIEENFDIDNIADLYIDQYNAVLGRIKPD